MGALDKLGLLIWKNFLLQKRRPVATIIELLLPIFYTIILVIIRNEIDVTEYANMTTWREFKVNSLPEFSMSSLPENYKWTVAFAPDDVEFYHHVMEKAKTKLNQIPMTRTEQKCGIRIPTFLQILENPEDAMTLLNDVGPASPPGRGRRNVLPPGMLNAGLQSAYNSLPFPLKRTLDTMAEESNSTSQQLLMTPMANNNIVNFTKQLVEIYFNNTINCFLADLEQMFAKQLNSSSNRRNDEEEDKDPMANLTMSDMFDYFSTVPEINLMPFPSEQAFLDFVQNETNLNTVLAGVFFHGEFTNSTLESNDLRMTLRFQADPLNSGSSNRIAGGVSRWVTHLLFPSFQRSTPRSKNDPAGGRPGYYKEGFLSLQHAIYTGIASTLANNIPGRNNFALKRYPYPPYVEDTFIIAIQRTLPMIIMLSFIYTSLVIVRSVVLEKESKMKEYMMMMGLSNWLHWLAWFIKYIIFLCVSCIAMVLLFKVPTPYGSVLTYSDATVMFLFLILYCAATITMCFFLSTLFSKANVGAAAGGVIYGLTYMPSLYMLDTFDQLDTSLKILSCILPNLAMTNTCQLLSMFEGAGVGIHWSNLNSPVTVDDNFTILQIFLMLIFDCFFYMLLTWYVEGILPGEYGIPKPWYFPFMKSYWTGIEGKSNLQKTDDVEMTPAEMTKSGDYFEDEPTDLAKIIFHAGGKTKVAVNNLSLNMYEGQINVLLGHNGAGKTTTMSILTGFFPPTSGEATVMGHSIITDMAGVRKSLGLCPQFNILFDLLTVDEHLYFFSRLKGLDSVEATKSVQEMRDCLKLNDKANAKSHTLSGGMKRKLSVGIALSAGSKYVILDEPTSGMDPAARRAIWEVIQEYRSKCSMLLSTHFMDEADLLGDWISIMADGKLRCAGSSVFLKNKFGVGYHAILTKTQDCDVTKLNDFFHSFVPNCHLERTAGGEVSFLLPFNSSPHFPNLFQALEENSTQLGITNFGATVTTLEEVFLRVTEDAETAVEAISKKISKQASSILADNSPGENINSTPAVHGKASSTAYNTGVVLWFQQFYGLFVKHLLHSKRNYKVAIAQILVPVVFGIFAILQVKYPPFVQDNVPLDLTLNAYGDSFVYATNDSSSFAQEFIDVYKNQFEGSQATASQLTEDLEEFVSALYKEQGGNFNSKNLISATFAGNDSINTSDNIAWFNNQAYHTPATALAYLDQAYIRLIANRSKFNITLINSPLDRKTSDRVQEELVGSLSGFLMAFNIVLGFSFLAASFCLFLVRERVDRSSLLQTLAGVDPVCFWLSAFVWDFINFLTPCLVTMIMFAAFQIEELNSNAGIVLLLFVLYCWSSLPLMYALSFLFVIPSTALVRVTILNMITGLASILSVNILSLLDMADTANTLNWIFLFLPQYCLGQGLSDIYTNYKMVNVCTESLMMEQICNDSNITFQTDFLAWESLGVGKFMTFLGIQGVVFFAIIMMIEFEYLPLMWNLFSAGMKWIYSKVFKPNQTSSQGPASRGIEDDEDVVKEKARINETSLQELSKTDRLIIHNLRKVYESAPTPLVAVDSLCIGIPPAECFGLLGINGAGKTTTFKMLSGDYKPSSGTAYLEGFCIRKNLRQVQQRLGYCPQWDGLIEQMTGAETLRLFARLRGVPEPDIPACIQHLGKSLHFFEHLHKNCGTYSRTSVTMLGYDLSGGNKRKLSTAIALVGNPPVVLLDEPSTGMDPGARRMLWDSLSDIRSSGCSIVITSHSMEECEALCTRLAIMVNGQLRCLGGPQHLKNRFGQGYTIDLKMPLSMTDFTSLKNYMNLSFPGCDIKDPQQGLVTFRVAQHRPDGSVLKLSKVFSLMEDSKSAVGVIEYTVSQTTLEQVFLSLVRWQRETSDDDNVVKQSN